MRKLECLCAEEVQFSLQGSLSLGGSKTYLLNRQLLYFLVHWKPRVQSQVCYTQ